MGATRTFHLATSWLIASGCSPHPGQSGVPAPTSPISTPVASASTSAAQPPRPADQAKTVFRDRCVTFNELDSADVDVAYGAARSRLYRTEDGGRRWIRVYETTAVPGEYAPWIDVVRVVSRLEVWIHAGGKLLHSRDGGKTFAIVDIGDRVLRGLRFVDERLGYLVGEQSGHASYHGIVLKTVDGGQSWVELPTGVSPGFDWRLRDVWPVSADDVWVVGDVLLHSTNGGTTWSLIKGKSGFAIQFSSRAVGWIVHKPPRYYDLTTDGGRTWMPREVPFQYPEYSGLTFVDAKNGWAAAGDLYQTKDGGRKWTDVRKGGAGDDDPYYYAVEYLQKERVVIATSTCDRIVVKP